MNAHRQHQHHKPNQTKRIEKKKIKIFDDNYRGFVNVFVDYFDLYTNMNSTYRKMRKQNRHHIRCVCIWKWIPAE